MRPIVNAQSFVKVRLESLPGYVTVSVEQVAHQPLCEIWLDARRREEIRQVIIMESTSLQRMLMKLGAVPGVYKVRIEKDVGAAGTVHTGDGVIFWYKRKKKDKT